MTEKLINKLIAYLEGLEGLVTEGAAKAAPVLSEMATEWITYAQFRAVLEVAWVALFILGSVLVGFLCLKVVAKAMDKGEKATERDTVKFVVGLGVAFVCSIFLTANTFRIKGAVEVAGHAIFSPKTYAIKLLREELGDAAKAKRN